MIRAYNDIYNSIPRVGNVSEYFYSLHSCGISLINQATNDWFHDFSLSSSFFTLHAKFITTLFLIDRIIYYLHEMRQHQYYIHSLGGTRYPWKIKSMNKINFNLTKPNEFDWKCVFLIFYLCIYFFSCSSTRTCTQKLFSQSTSLIKKWLLHWINYYTKIQSLSCTAVWYLLVHKWKSKYY